MYCPKCATGNPDEAQFCRECGFQMLKSPEWDDRKSRSNEGWSGLVMTGLVIGTLFIPLIGIIFGAVNLKKEGIAGQATVLLIIGIVMTIINTILIFGI